MVQVEGLSKSFDKTTQVLRDISFTISPHEVVAILGPSGTGKSTLLRCLNYLCQPTTGVITIGGARVDALRHTKKEIRALRAHSAMVFQGYHLFKNKTALENVMTAPMLVQHKSRAEAQAKALALLERVGIARALAMEPDVLLFDEPTSALDPELVGEVLETIRSLAMERKSTMLIVTHEVRFARQVASRILFMDEGRIAADGAPEDIIDHPDNPRIQQFLQFIGK